MPVPSLLVSSFTRGGSAVLIRCLVANEGNRIQIPDGTILENSKSIERFPFRNLAYPCLAELVSGNLAVIDH